ncbi:hypothetical protein [Aestuariimicrobium sp. T2.26MG-19.2B]|uniref:hypothetical protein n=1 Tax=Aestuariimicrobium sp. T2.26MG-19.2B TaxID=3040679 RepID=UPI0024773F57|nr:hypothetical protein [Aestuariimicrobium sp. T2.26MG-19.2B]CAI9407443.1 hypothetical protein AESSP_01822 [Aestuariimicrobium sp. T2.26MG-19.2B]
MSGVERHRLAIAWFAVGLTVAAFAIGWISLLSGGLPQASTLATFMGGGLVPLVHALASIVALVWAATAAPRLDVRAPAGVLGGLLVVDAAVGLVFGVVALMTDRWRFATSAGDAVELVAKLGLAVICLLVAAHPAGDRATSPPQFPAPHAQTPQLPGQQSVRGGAPTQPSAQQLPSWQPDQASGGAWLRAGDAATGASASTWGEPTETPEGRRGPASWEPAPRDQDRS